MWSQNKHGNHSEDNQMVNLLITTKKDGSIWYKVYKTIFTAICAGFPTAFGAVDFAYIQLV